MRLYTIGWLRPIGKPGEVTTEVAHWVRMSGPHSNYLRAESAGEVAMAGAMAGLAFQGFELVDYRVVNDKGLVRYGLAIGDDGKQSLPGMERVGP